MFAAVSAATSAFASLRYTAHRSDENGVGNRGAAKAASFGVPVHFSKTKNSKSGSVLRRRKPDVSINYFVTATPYLPWLSCRCPLA